MFATILTDLPALAADWAKEMMAGVNIIMSRLAPVDRADRNARSPVFPVKEKVHEVPQ